MKAFYVSALIGAVAAAPVCSSTQNSYSAPDNATLASIQAEAGGSLPNIPLPTDLSQNLITILQLVAAQEILEVAYFTELHHNISNNVPGFETTEEDREFVLGAVKRIRAQEQLHYIGANGILQANGAQTVGSCKYQFPVSDFQGAVALANAFTDIVLGVLPLIQLQSAINGGPDGASLIQLFGSIEEQEAEQDGWFRILQGKFPSAAPFLSQSTPEFALSAAQLFLVPGSCPPEYAAVQVAIKSFPPLTVTSPPTAEKQTASYSVPGDIRSANAIAYISGQNLPVTVPIMNIQKSGSTTTFDASFPAAAEGFADGLTIAAVVCTDAKFANATEVAQNTLFGPGIIEFN